ncbi:MAG: oxidoreductase family protein [Candidatus Azotimanducaceae bacterium WSBS_2022_MAG_OTU7]
MITQSDVPFSLKDITVDWFTMALRESGVINGEQVVSFTYNIIGEEAGFNGEVAIFKLEYSDQNSGVPGSMVLKIPTALKNRTLGQTMGLYEKEIRFYRDLESSVSIRTPRHYYSALDVADDPDIVLERLVGLNKLPMWLIAILSVIAGWVIGLTPRRYALLIEDLSGYRMGDQAAGCSEEDTKNVLTAMAKLHGQYWDSKELPGMSWIAPMAVTSKIIQMMFLQNIGKFSLANKDTLSERQVQLTEWFKVNGAALTEKLGEESPTLLHGDCRLDNICFDDEKDEIILFDWQTMSSGPGGLDMAYFLSAALPVGTSEEKLNELLNIYHEALQDAGVEISSARLRWQYEMGMLATLQRIIPAAHTGQLDLGSDRGPQMMQAWLDKIFDKVKNVQFETILDRVPD